MTALHGDGELLRLHVGTDVVNLDDLTREGGPGTADVVVGFFHALTIAHPGGSRSSRWYQMGNSFITRAYHSAAIDGRPPWV